MNRRPTRKPQPPLEDADIYVATSSGVVRIDGALHRYFRGATRVRRGHPLLSAVPGRFIPDRSLEPLA